MVFSMSQTYLDQMAFSYLSLNQPLGLDLLSLPLICILCLVRSLVFFWGTSPQNKVSANWKQQQCHSFALAQIKLEETCHVCRDAPEIATSLGHPGRPLWAQDHSTSQRLGWSPVTLPCSDGTAQPPCAARRTHGPALLQGRAPLHHVAQYMAEWRSLRQLWGRDFGSFSPKIAVAMPSSIHVLLEITRIIKSTEVSHTYQQLENNLRKLHGRNSITGLPESTGECGRTAGLGAAFFSLEIHETK